MTSFAADGFGPIDPPAADITAAVADFPSLSAMRDAVRSAQAEMAERLTPDCGDPMDRAAA